MKKSIMMTNHIIINIQFKINKIYKLRNYNLIKLIIKLIKLSSINNIIKMNNRNMKIKNSLKIIKLKTNKTLIII